MPGFHSKSFLLILLLVSLALLLVACNQSGSVKRYQQQLFVFGTLVDITLITDDPQQAQAAIDKITVEFDRMQEHWHPWQGGELAQINKQLPSLQVMTISSELAGLIQQSQILSKQSLGLFNPAIGKLIRVWHFDKLDKESFQFTLPEPHAIKAIVTEHPQMSDLLLTPNPDKTFQLQSSNPAVQLDFGAYAKGVALEKMMTILKQFNIHNALINAGGDLKVMGSKFLSDTPMPWYIGIKNPQYSQNPEQASVLAAINLKDGEALFTSGDYERFFSINQQHYHHIIDPRTGYSGQGVHAVTVLHNNAALADAAATAIFLAGPEHAMQIARNMGISYVLLVDSKNRLYLSPAMAKRLQLKVDNPVTILAAIQNQSDN